MPMLPDLQTRVLLIPYVIMPRLPVLHTTMCKRDTVEIPVTTNNYSIFCQRSKGMTSFLVVVFLSNDRF